MAGNPCDGMLLVCQRCDAWDHSIVLSHEIASEVGADTRNHGRCAPLDVMGLSRLFDSVAVGGARPQTAETAEFATGGCPPWWLHRRCQRRHDKKPLGKFPCTGGHRRLCALLVAYGDGEPSEAD